MRRAFCGLLAAPLLLAQAQSTFYSAYQDGLEAERQGLWGEAAAAYRRALVLRPGPAARVVTYGNNLLFNYYPRTRLARCLLEQRDLEGAETELHKALGEPPAEREALTHRIQEARAKSLRPAPVPAAVDSRPHPPPDPSPAAAPPPQNDTQPRPAEPAPVPSLRPALPASPNPPAVPVEKARPEPAAAASPGPPATVEARPLGPTPPAQPAREPAEGTRSNHPANLIFALGLGLVALLAWFRRRKTEDAPLPAEQIGPYRIQRLLGRGGFSNTLLAVHSVTGREVALKVPHAHRAEDPEFRARFRQEAELGARLEHPHLVRILDPGSPEAPPYLAMEYAPGQSLDQRMKETGPMPLSEAIDIALGVADAMAYAHANGVIHRDLKPGNIQLTGQGLKVMDLGIARVMDTSTVTTTYAFLGTPLYAAPEAQMKTHVGPAADRYSLGVILYHMLAGRPPFEGETPFETLDHHRRTPPPVLTALRPDVPPALGGLVQSLLAKDPDLRPDDQEVLQALSQARIALGSGPTG